MPGRLGIPCREGARWGTLRLVSVTTGGNGQCNSNNVDYRVDTASSRAFLGQFLRLP